MNYFLNKKIITYPIGPDLGPDLDTFIEMLETRTADIPATIICDNKYVLLQTNHEELRSLLDEMFVFYRTVPYAENDDFRDYYCNSGEHELGQVRLAKAKHALHSVDTQVPYTSVIYIYCYGKDEKDHKPAYRDKHKTIVEILLKLLKMARKLDLPVWIKTSENSVIDGRKVRRFTHDQYIGQFINNH